MVNDVGIARAANILRRQHGAEAAALHAAMRADELLDAGDTEGAAVWRRIKNEVEAMRQRGAVGGPS